MPEELVIMEWSSDTREHPILIGGFDPRKVSEAIDQKINEMLGRGIPSQENHFKIVELDFSGKPFHLALQGFLVFDPPLESRSSKQDSKALYCAANEEEGLLIQYLLPYSKTSSHDHSLTRWIEIYKLMAGKATLLTKREGQDSVKEINLKNTNVIVKPDETHQVMTTTQPSLLLITIQDDSGWFKEWLTGGGHRFRPPLIPKNT